MFSYSRVRFGDYAWSHEKFFYHNQSCWNWKRHSRYAVRNKLNIKKHKRYFILQNKKETLKIPKLKMVSVNYRWHSRTILRPVATVRVRWIPTREQLPLPGRLRRQRKTIFGDNLPVACIQNQVSRELLFAPRKPRVRVHQQDIWILRWM